MTDHNVSTDEGFDGRPDYVIAKEQLAALMAREHLTVTAVFVPFSMSRHVKGGADSWSSDGKPWLSLNWTVTLLRKGKPILTTDYAQGSGHAPGDKATPASTTSANRPYPTAKRLLIEWECEHGMTGYWLWTGIVRKGSADKARITPDPVDVFGSLAGNADVLNYSSYEDWAQNLGYDPDSRSGERVYRACLDVALKLRKGLGEAVMTEAAELAWRL